MRADIKTSHMKLDGDGKPVGLVEFDLSDEESQGTQKFIALTGPITHTLEEGAILVVDELQARLHPLLTQAILALFHGPANPLNAQLICATHDVMLMDPQRLRRDQIWFCAKDERGTTDLYTLADFDPDQVRPTTKFSRQYLLGIFGAVPKLAHFEEAAIKTGNPFAEIWVLFDRDSFAAQNFNRAFDLAHGHDDIIACWSNECFEICYLLHFAYRDTGIARTEIWKALSTHLGKKYDKADAAVFEKLEPNLDTALKNARKLAASRTGDAKRKRENPSTKVHELVELLRQFDPHRM